MLTLEDLALSGLAGVLCATVSGDDRASLGGDRVLPYALLYRLGFAPWERRDVADAWRHLLDGTDPPVTGRALDVGCGSGRDAVYLAKRGWTVTAVDSVDKALATARRRAVEEGVEVQWVKGDVAALDWLGLEPATTSSTTSAASTASPTRRAQAPPPD